eukprot:244132-Chlamydomonas_euryale.AAC.24
MQNSALLLSATRTYPMYDSREEVDHAVPLIWFCGRQVFGAAVVLNMVHNHMMGAVQPKGYTEWDADDPWQECVHPCMLCGHTGAMHANTWPHQRLGLKAIPDPACSLPAMHDIRGGFTMPEEWSVLCCM